MSRPIHEVMTRDGLVTAPVGTTLEEAKAILRKNKIEKLPLVDENFALKGLITIKDIEKALLYPNSARDDKGRLIVGAAIGDAPNVLDRCAALLDAHENDARVKRARSNVDALHAAGEITATARAGVRRAAHARHHAALDAERAAAEEEIVLLDLLGLRPGTSVTLAFPLPEPPAASPPAGDVRALLRHPHVQSALARLNGTEAALEAEIRRQYPELKLGPAYANEEGLDRLGLVAGVTLPLWNRNRKGIAEAKGARDEARRTAVDRWRSLVCAAAKAHVTLETLLRHPPEPASARNDADALADAGELPPLDYLNVREEILDAHLAEADWRRDVALALAERDRFN
jgi:outer membrane protein TolC